jgi:hypothetical protein
VDADMKLLVIMCILESLGTSNLNSKAIHFWDWSYEYKNIPYEMAIAVAWHESKLHHRRYRKENKTGDVGIMQINVPSWGNRCRGKCNLKKLRYNIKFGYKVLYYGLRRGDAIYYYNPGNSEYKSKILKIMKEIKQTRDECLAHIK